MALVESNAAFTQRCNEIDPTGNFGNALGTQNISTFSAMAFSLGTPQTAPTEQQFNTLGQAVFGPGVTLGQTSMLRRMHFEATTLMIASVKQRVDGEAADKADAVKRIPIAEKRYRLEQQERRLTGVNISGELEPSHQLLDLTNSIWRQGHWCGLHLVDAPKGLTKYSLQSKIGLLPCRWKTNNLKWHRCRRSSEQTMAVRSNCNGVGRGVD